MAGRSRIVRYSASFIAITALACRDNPVQPPAAAAITMLVAAPNEAVVGASLSPSPAFAVRDADGAAIAGLPVSITVKEGGGTIVGAPRRTGAGETRVGTWTLGTRAGRNVLEIRVASLAPLEIVVTGVPDAPASILAQGNGQSGLAGDELAQPLAVRVTDRFGNGIGGLDVSFNVGSGNGTLTPDIAPTDAGGLAGVHWRLGNKGGLQRVVATAGGLTANFTAAIRSDFQLDVRFYGTLPAANIQAAFQAAAERVRAAVIGDLSDVTLQGFDLSRCGVTNGPLSEAVDDIIIFATVTFIDGPGKILGSAGPCMTRTQAGFPTIGVMRFDVDDLNALATSGRLEAVILHEMLHVVGVGTLWRSKDLLFGSGTQDPRFTGALGAFRCLAAGGTSVCSDSRIPIENTGNAGTIEAHWRESVFDSELMTGFAETTPNMPLSAMTIASLDDLGLTGNTLAADPYFLPTASFRLSPGESAATPPPSWEILEIPRFEVTPAGWVRPIVRK